MVCPTMSILLIDKSRNNESMNLYFYNMKVIPLPAKIVDINN